MNEGFSEIISRRSLIDDLVPAISAGEADSLGQKLYVDYRELLEPLFEPYDDEPSLFSQPMLFVNLKDPKSSVKELEGTRDGGVPIFPHFLDCVWLGEEMLVNAKFIASILVGGEKRWVELNAGLLWLDDQPNKEASSLTITELEGKRQYFFEGGEVFSQAIALQQIALKRLRGAVKRRESYKLVTIESVLSERGREILRRISPDGKFNNEGK